MLVLLGLAGMTNGLASKAPMGRTNDPFVFHDYMGQRVHASRFSRSNSDVTSFLTSTGSSYRQHGVMDTGTTECTSGRRKLFPDALIERYDPPIKVEIANGHSLPVGLQGAMKMKVWSTRTVSTKKFRTITVGGSLYVPSMPVTLISTKALFRREGIRSYFNDELRLILPDGDVVRFHETQTNYTLPFADDTDVIVCLPEFNTSNATTLITLLNPEPLEWELAHDRYVHFNPKRILASEPYVTGC